MSVSNLEYTRRYSFFAPKFTYVVRHGGTWIGEVARMEGERKWHASNITWTGGRDFPDTYRTRADAAWALYYDALKRGVL